MHYTSAPYSHSDPTVVERRITQFFEAELYISTVLKYHTVSPLYKTILTKYKPDMPVDYSTWQSYCDNLIQRCDGIIVITMAGWELSVGVRDEIKLAERYEKEVIFFDPILQQMNFIYPSELN